MLVSHIGLIEFFISTVSLHQLVSVGGFPVRLRIPSMSIVVPMIAVTVTNSKVEVTSNDRVSIRMRATAKRADQVPALRRRMRRKVDGVDVQGQVLHSDQPYPKDVTGTNVIWGNAMKLASKRFLKDNANPSTVGPVSRPIGDETTSRKPLRVRIRSYISTVCLLNAIEVILTRHVNNSLSFFKLMVDISLD